MRPMWEGTISFGLVNIPIKLYSGSNSPTLGLTFLHKEDASPVRYAKICRTEEKEISSQEIVKGYAYQKNEYVILDEKDFEGANIQSTHSIDILKFFDEKELDLRYVEKPYYLEPTKASGKAYVLLREALIKSKKIALAICVLHNREHLAIIKPIDSILVLDFLRFFDEVRDTKGLEIPNTKSVTEKEINMAIDLIHQLTGHFEPMEYHDRYKEILEKVIENKISGKVTAKTKVKSPRVTAAKDLMMMLKASLKKTKKTTSPLHRKKSAKSAKIHAAKHRKVG
jgi:DNA end-binding protein Ku